MTSDSETNKKTASDPKKVMSGHSSDVSNQPDQTAGEIEMLHVISDPTRIQILKTLAGGEAMCGKDILAHFTITQPTLSHHMSLLCEKGLVDSVKDGKYIRYRICKNGIRRFIAIFEAMLSETDKPEPSSKSESKANVPQLKKAPTLPKPKAVIRCPDVPADTMIEKKKIKKKDKSADLKKGKKKKKKS
ncbi:MAG: metalloregulator ArsR/SmtB family transcription factor [Oscillospiraceae bacterium]|jgi:ArsR family transcriptional regulator|nr:metalloregulator ArsR/SmtB family transcription factor [Oscillospiraceae bacterium]